MNKVKSRFLKILRQNDKVKSILAYENRNQVAPMADGFDLLLLVITTDDAMANYTSHYSKDNNRIQELWIDPAGIEHWILVGGNHNIIQWILQGEILLDKDTYLEGIRDQVVDFPMILRERKLLVEFSQFLRRHLQSKEYLKEGHLLDAYSNILESLHHWARIVIIEAGIHPEVTVWSQVHKINPGVYKLYEELTQSSETLEQRVQLVLLACEFSVMSKMENCCAMLIRILQSRRQPWSPMDLIEHPELKELCIEISLILKKMVKKALIKEVAVAVEENLDVLELKYTS